MPARPRTLIAQLTPEGPVAPQSTVEVVEGAVHAYYFYANDCPHCLAVLEDTLTPLMDEHGSLLDIRFVGDRTSRIL